MKWGSLLAKVNLSSWALDLISSPTQGVLSSPESSVFPFLLDLSPKCTNLLSFLPIRDKDPDLTLPQASAPWLCSSLQVICTCLSPNLSPPLLSWTQISYQAWPLTCSLRSPMIPTWLNQWSVLNHHLDLNATSLPNWLASPSFLEPHSPGSLFLFVWQHSPCWFLPISPTPHGWSVPELCPRATSLSPRFHSNLI